MESSGVVTIAAANTDTLKSIWNTRQSNGKSSVPNEGKSSSFVALSVGEIIVFIRAGSNLEN